MVKAVIEKQSIVGTQRRSNPLILGDYRILSRGDNF